MAVPPKSPSTQSPAILAAPFPRQVQPVAPLAKALRQEGAASARAGGSANTMLSAMQQPGLTGPKVSEEMTLPADIEQPSIPDHLVHQTTEHGLAIGDEGPVVTARGSKSPTSGAAAAPQVSL